MTNQTNNTYRIDALQYSAWSTEIFQQMRQAQLDAVHVTIAYHENFQETVRNIITWKKLFQQNSKLICNAHNADDILKAKKNNKTAIIFGLQTAATIEDDIGLIEIIHNLGIRFMQLSYNNQSLLATGCYETHDNGITRMGKEVIREMNQTGLVIDMSHSAEISTLQAIEISQRPIAITHANSFTWCNALRNKSDTVLKELANSGGMLGLSLYPHHLKDKTKCSPESFCDMIKHCVDIMGINNIGIGSDLCQNQPDSIVEWMRNGRWTKNIDYGEGSAKIPGFPKQPSWFTNSLGFNNIEKLLKNGGFNQIEINKILGNNWLNFCQKSFTPNTTAE